MAKSCKSHVVRTDLLVFKTFLSSISPVNVNLAFSHVMLFKPRSEWNGQWTSSSLMVVQLPSLIDSVLHLESMHPQLRLLVLLQVQQLSTTRSCRALMNQCHWSRSEIDRENNSLLVQLIQVLQFSMLKEMNQLYLMVLRSLKASLQWFLLKPLQMLVPRFGLNGLSHSAGALSKLQWSILQG